MTRQHHHPLPLVVGRIDRLYHCPTRHSPLNGLSGSSEQVVTRCKFTREVVQQSSSEFGVSLKVISLWGLHGGYNEKTHLNSPPPPEKTRTLKKNNRNAGIVTIDWKIRHMGANYNNRETRNI
jgi:hypothetical protein